MQVDPAAPSAGATATGSFDVDGQGPEAAARQSSTGDRARGNAHEPLGRIAAFLERHRRCAPLIACYDRFFLWFLTGMGYRLPVPIPQQAHRQAQSLRFLLLVCLFCFGVAVSDQVFCVLKGWILLILGISPGCLPLRQWLMGYCMALTMLPFWFGIAGPLIIWWAINGNLIRTTLPDSCKESSPVLWSFVDQVFISSFATCTSTIVGALFFLCLRQRAQQLHRIWGTQGPAQEAVINRILSEPVAEALPGAECSICLDEDAADSRWRLLRCGHRFHEACLLEWLRRARRCPLCRLDLNEAYLLAEQNSDSEAGAAEA